MLQFEHEFLTWVRVRVLVDTGLLVPSHKDPMWIYLQAVVWVSLQKLHE